MGRSVRELAVRLEPPYPVFIGAGALEPFMAHLAEPQVALLADDTVDRLHGQKVEAALRAAGKRVQRFTFPAGEASKSLGTFGWLLEQLADANLDRQSAVVALGGGVSGDLSGFVAASFLRGVAFYQLPTTLLAMVDSSIGGKTGVNLPQGKNLVGAFWQPKAVAIEPSFLATLPERVFREGAVELFKAGLLADPDLLPQVTKPGFRPGGDPEVLGELIERGVRVKADIVAADATEQGVRAHLNLGHTLAHALEAASRHALSHGDAVGYGLYYAARLAARRGFEDLSETVRDFLEWLGPAPLPPLEWDQLTGFMQRDKKTRQGQLTFVLLEQPGAPVLVRDLREDELRAAWRDLKEARP